MAKTPKPEQAETPPKIEVKSVRHDFNPEEVAELNGEFRRSFEDLKVIESDFDNVKATFKAKLTEKESRMETLNATLNAGFEMRNKRCRVEYRTAARQKVYYLEDAPDAPNGTEPVLIVEMTSDDFQQELFHAESKFERREVIELFPPTGPDFGILIVGRFKSKWFSALRVSVGPHKLEERLDSEQPAAKARSGALDRSSAAYQAWLDKNLGKDAAKGFAEPLVKALAGQHEKAE